MTDIDKCPYLYSVAGREACRRYNEIDLWCGGDCDSDYCWTKYNAVRDTIQNDMIFIHNKKQNVIILPQYISEVKYDSGNRDFCDIITSTGNEYRVQLSAQDIFELLQRRK